MTAPIISLRGVTKVFSRGEHGVTALAGLDLDIEAGEFVAIVGASGSGKSTLLNLIGGLDEATSGEIIVAGTRLADLDADSLADFRARTVGFAFQQYHLLSSSSALENMEMAGLYGGLASSRRAERAQALSLALGLSDRLDHRPAHLSGGQQQRVAIARALFNGPRILLADEPTGALDSRTGAEILAIFRDLHAQGNTIVLITHDVNVAAAAERIVTIADGKIVDDRRTRSPATPAPPQATEPPERLAQGRRGALRPALAAGGVALRLLRTRWLRTVLTLFGTVVGIAAVIAIVAVGEGAKRSVLNAVASLGSNLVVVMKSWERRPVNDAPPRGFTLEEAEAVRALPHIAYAVIENPVTMTVQAEGEAGSTLVTATEVDFPFVHDWPVTSGMFFDDADARGHAPVVVIGTKVADRFFRDRDPIGRVLTIGNGSFHIVGVMAAKGASPGGIDLDDTVFLPYSTYVVRLGGDREAKFLMAKTRDGAAKASAAREIEELVTSMRGRREISARTIDGMIAAELRAKDILTALLGSVALISLVVGGVGIMNISLVGVSERTREIGLRMALGARRSDIGFQFLTETLVMALIGGVGGIVVGIVAVKALGVFGVPADLNIAAILAAFGLAAAVGIAAGIIPANKAAKMNPVQALATV